MDGEPRIEGRRITVLRLQDLVEQRGLPAPEVADMHDLDVATVYHALAYYHARPDEMAAVRSQRDEKSNARSMRVQTRSPACERHTLTATPSDLNVLSADCR